MITASIRKGLIMCNNCLNQYVGQTVDMFRSQWNNYKDNSRKFERGEKLRKDTFTNIFSYEVILVFCKIPLLFSLIRPILRHPLSMNITGFIPTRQKHLWDLMLKVVTESLSFIVIVQLFLFLDLDSLFQDYSWFTHIIDTFILFHHFRQYLQFSAF